MIERTLIIIKPDGVKRCLIGDVIKRFETAGLKIVGMKMVWSDEKFAGQHYRTHKSKPFFKDLVKFIVEGPVVAFVLEGVHAVSNARRLVGPTSPHEAAPGTIRGDYAHLSMKYANELGIGGRNIIHSSGTKKEAEEEIKLWFKPKELHTYKIVHEVDTF